MEENKKISSRIEITDAVVRKVFFGNVDVSKFSRQNDDYLVKEIKSIIQIWEENRGEMIKVWY